MIPRLHLFSTYTPERHSAPFKGSPLPYPEKHGRAIAALHSSSFESLSMLSSSSSST